MALLCAVLFAVGCVRSDDEAAGGEGSLSLRFAFDPGEIVVSKADPVAPDVNEFTVQIINSTGKVIKEWGRVAEVPEKVNIQTGRYTLKAFYGKSVAAEFDAPYYEGATEFTISKDQVNEVLVTCSRANVRVSVDYKQGFKQYFKDYYVQIGTSKDSLTFAREEARSGYVAAGNLGAKVTMIRQNGKELTYEPAVTPGAIGPEHYKFMFDVEEGAGGATLVITFSDLVTETPVKIDLNREWIPNAKPFINPTGFESNTVFTQYAGERHDLSMLVTGRNLIRSCVLTASPSLVALGWPETVDLADMDDANEANMTARADAQSFGATWTRTIKGLQMGQINLTGITPRLKMGEYELNVVVTDEMGQVNEPFVVKIKVDEPTFQFLDKAPYVFMNASEAVLNFSMPAGDIGTVQFSYDDGWGNAQPCQKDKVTTTMVSPGIYQVRLPIQFANKSVKVFAQEGLRKAETSVGVQLATFEIDRVPDGDRWPRKIYLDVAMQNGAEPTEVSVDLFDENSGKWVQASMATPTGVSTRARVAVLDLLPDKQYTLRAVYGRAQTSPPMVVRTETPTVLPNGGFNNWRTVDLGSMNQGGRQTKQWTKWGPITNDDPVTGSVKSYELFSDWATVNNKTAWTGSGQSNKNTWFVVPSTLWTDDRIEGAGAALIRNVGWHNNGSVPDNNVGATTLGVSSYPGVPKSPNGFLKSVGKLFLGKYSVTHNGAGGVTESYDHGLDFTGHPAQVSFSYKYAPEGVDQGYFRAVLVNYTDGVRTVLAQTEMTLSVSGSYKTATATFNYDAAAEQLRPTSIEVMFASSNKQSSDWSAENRAGIATSPVAGLTFTEGYGGPFCSVGSQLWVDDVKLIY